MAIMQGITGKLSGKMGSAVFRVRKGAQVVAQYNPNVSNPKSKGQNDQRAKFKLASQLAAEIGNSMAFNLQARAGHGSPTQRNEFIKTNLPQINIVENNGSQAKIAMAAIQLTNSQKPFLADISASVTEPGSLSVGFILENNEITQVVVVLMGIGQETVYNGDGTMSVLSRPEKRGEELIDVVNGRASVTFTYDSQIDSNTLSVLTYGIIPTTGARVAISNNTANVANNVAFATNSIQRELRQNNISVTATRGLPAVR